MWIRVLVQQRLLRQPLTSLTAQRTPETDPPWGPAFVWLTCSSMRPRLSWRRPWDFYRRAKAPATFNINLRSPWRRCQVEPQLYLRMGTVTAALIIPPDDIQSRLPHTQRLGHRQFANCQLHGASKWLCVAPFTFPAGRALCWNSRSAIVIVLRHDNSHNNEQGHFKLGLLLTWSTGKFLFVHTVDADEMKRTRFITIGRLFQWTAVSAGHHEAPLADDSLHYKSHFQRIGVKTDCNWREKYIYTQEE